MITEFPMDREEKKAYTLQKIEEAVELNGGIIKTAEILDLGIDYRRIEQFVSEGSLRKVRNGVYTTVKIPYSEDKLIATMFGDGVLTMESALYAYGYIDIKPMAYTIAISKNVSKSRFSLEYPMVIPYYTEPGVLELGVSETDLDGNPMKIYTIDRLICDVLKYEDRLTKETFRKAVMSYVNDSNKDIAKLMEYSAKRKVRQKVQSIIGMWL